MHRARYFHGNITMHGSLLLKPHIFITISVSLSEFLKYKSHLKSQKLLRKIMYNKDLWQFPWKTSKTFLELVLRCICTAQDIFHGNMKIHGSLQLRPIICLPVFVLSFSLLPKHLPKHYIVCVNCISVLNFNFEQKC